MDNKNLIVILLLLAAGVAGYFYFKKSKKTTTKTVDTEKPEAQPLVDTNSTDNIIDSLSMSASDKVSLKNWVRTVNKAIDNKSGNWDKVSVMERAENNSVTYSMQVVMDSIYQMYVTAKSLTKTQYDTYVGEIYDMN